MSPCQKCNSFRLIVKALVILSCIFAEANFLVWIGHHANPTHIYEYKEPLSAEQEEMKSRFLSARSTLEIITTKNGTRLYFDQKTGVATANRPEWLNQDDMPVLTEQEMFDIASLNIVTVRMFAIETIKPAEDMVLYLVLMMAVSAFGLMLGAYVSFNKIFCEKNELGVMLTLLFIPILASLVFPSQQNILIALMIYLFSLFISLLPIPLFTAIDSALDKFLSRRSTKTT